MKNTDSFRTSHGLVLAALFALGASACGGAVMSGVAVGKVGHGLSEHARMVPQGAEVCGMQEALNNPDKPIGESCAKQAKNDRLWRGALTALGAYGEAIESMASGTGVEGAGQIEAARTGIRGNDWVEVDGAAEQGAREAAGALMAKLDANSGKGDLERMVKEAAPHVKTLCDGLTSYLEAQTKAFGDLGKEAEKKRALRQDRRCGSLDSRSVCVGESVVDRMLYGKVFAQAQLLESDHAQARDAVAGFCAAHHKAEEAAKKGDLGSSRTYTEILDAVRGAKKAAPEPAAPKKK
jgi:hypothetical protein